MIDCLRRHRVALPINVHNNVLGVHSHIFDISNNLDIASLSSGMVVACSSYTLNQNLGQ